jgi:hypothetical protein
MKTYHLLTSIALFVTIINFSLIITNCYTKKSFNTIKLEILFVSLFIALIWTIYGYMRHYKHIFIGNIIIVILILFLFIMNNKYS